MGSKTIYIADDDLSICEILSVILRDKGYNIIISNDGSSLLALDTIPDLIFLDVRMASVDGSELCKSWKLNPRTMLVPIIIVSANQDIPEIAKDCGADGWLAKPFEMQDLLRLAEEHTMNERKQLI